MGLSKFRVVHRVVPDVNVMFLIYHMILIRHDQIQVVVETSWFMRKRCTLTTSFVDFEKE
jgi:hypothetical protein